MGPHGYNSADSSDDGFYEEEQYWTDERVPKHTVRRIAKNKTVKVPRVVPDREAYVADRVEYDTEYYTVEKKVPYTVAKRVPYTTTRKVPYQVYEQEEYIVYKDQPY